MVNKYFENNKFCTELDIFISINKSNQYCEGSFTFPFIESFIRVPKQIELN